MQRFPFLLAELCPATRIILHQNLEEDGLLCPSECLRALWVAVCWKGWDRSQNNPICLTFRSQLYLTPDKNVCRRNKVWISLLVNVFLCPWYFVPEYIFSSFFLLCLWYKCRMFMKTSSYSNKNNEGLRRKSELTCFIP